jgi:soluble lytic murein transglycosylase-like protein
MTAPDDDWLAAAAGVVIVAGVWWYMNRQRELGGTDAGLLSVDDLDELTTGVLNAMSIWKPPASAAPYLAAIAAAELKYGLPSNMLARLLYQESRFRPDIITGKTASPAGALGIAQFMPATAKQFGINPLDPFQAIDAAGRYLSQLFRKFGSWSEALASYNWGQGNVSRKGLAAAPTETRNYFTQILSDLGLEIA